MTTVRLYGKGSGEGSHARVTRGFQRVLEASGLLAGVVDLFGIDDAEGPPPGGATARSALLTGPLSAAHRMHFNARHERRYAMVAPNSTEIGVRLENLLKSNLTHVLAPSNWAAGVLREKLDLPVAVVPHGVDAEFAPVLGGVERSGPERYLALHLSSTDRQRKGTEELIQAWHMASLPQAKLFLVLENSAMAMLTVKYAKEIARSGILLIPRLGLGGAGLAPEELSRFYQEFDLVVQPSRGEAFGMVPLEARASGVPVCATLCTGHSEHLSTGQAGVTVIEHGPLEPIDDLPGSKAPSVSPDAIAAALVRAYEQRKVQKEEAVWRAPSVARVWSWERVLESWIATLG